jgi:Serine kinase of the HPr protein, regulates carbohydrate metabolism
MICGGEPFSYYDCLSQDRFISSDMLRRTDLDHDIFIKSYGVVIRLTSNSPETFQHALPEITANLPGCTFDKHRSEFDHQFTYIWNPGRLDGVYKNGEKVAVRRRREWAFQLLGSQIRLTVAEHAPNHTFVHAGVVAVNNKGIVIPAKSFAGKTTLTYELVKRGAIYYSDEYAVIDHKGYIHPFPKDISMRGIVDDQTQVEITPASIGGTVGTKPVRTGLILITHYTKSSKWNPKPMTAGQAFLELINHTIPIRQNPQMTVSALTKMLDGATILRSPRGDAGTTADAILELLRTA